MDHDQLATLFTESLDSLREHVDERLQEQRDYIDSKLQAHGHVITSLTRRTSDLEAGATDRMVRLGGHDTKLAEHDYRLHALEARDEEIKRMRQDIHDGFAMLARLMRGEAK